MKVKIGNQLFDSNKQPIMVTFDEGEKELISSMRPEDKRFCSFPELSTVHEIEQFMKFNEEDSNQISLAIEGETFKIPASYPGD
ncbi:MAG: hypothetical protein K0Q73_8716 [Paenibacillus sp.]|jgi:hypothetical protein|nr:hypothetical protein [Paenibacillus sp.]